MNKTISITLNGLVFNIEEDAYNRLHTYLDGLKSHFDSQEYGKEVVSDIESRIAEQFSSILRDGKKQVINLPEVEGVIKTMGSVEDLTGGEPKKSQDNSTNKRLYRNPDDQIVAGVAGGIASYFNIDPLMPRLIFVVLSFASGFGVLLYILMWVIVPEANTSSKKLEMKGEAVNISNIEESHKEQSGKKKFSVIRYFFREVFYLIGRFFRALGPIIGTIIGLFLTAGAFVATFGLTLVGAIMLFNPNSQYIDPVISQVFNGSQYAMIVVAAYVAVIVPVLIALLVGVSFVRRKNIFTASMTTVFAILWLAGALTFGFMAAGAAPQIEAAVKSAQEQPQATKEFSAEKFTAIESGSDQRIKIIKGTEQKIVVSGREEELGDTEVEVKGTTLFIKNNEDNVRFCIICINRPLTIEITVPELVEVTANNASEITMSGFTTNDAFKISGNGAARIIFDGTVQNLEIDLNNASRMELIGQGQTMNVELSGASRLEAKYYTADEVEIIVRNASRANVTVTGQIKAEASGASRIIYSGDPAIELIEASNASRIEKE